MQVILNEDYPSLGFVGDLVKVKSGFARNFLFPKKIAVPSNASSIKLIEHRKRVIEVKKAERKIDATKLQARIEAVSITLQHAATADNKLFGSVTIAEIHQKLEEAGVTLDRRLLRIESPIKSVGEFQVDIRLHQEVTARVKVIVEKKPEDKSAKVEAAAKEPKKTSKKAAAKKEDAAPESADGQAVQADTTEV